MLCYSTRLPASFNQSQTKSVSELEKTNTELETQLTALSESAATYRSRAERSEARVEELESLFRARQVSKWTDNSLWC